MSVDRPGNWVLTFSRGAGSDPVPGKPDEIDAYAAEIRRIGKAMEDADESMRRIIANADGFESDGVDQFVKNSSEFGDGLKKAKGRYLTTADVLESFASELRDPQARSAKLLEDAEENRREYARVEADLEEARSRESSASDNANFLYTTLMGLKDSESEADKTRYRELNTQYTSANSALGSAQEDVSALEGKLRDLDDALQGFRSETDETFWAANEAADRAKSGIIGSTLDEVKDGFWQNLVKGLNLEFWAEVLSVVTTVLAVVALFVAFIPGLNVIAPLLFAIVMVVGVISFAVNASLAMSGDKGWGDAMWDLAGIATGGLGRVLGVVTKGANLLAKGGKAGTSAARGGAGAAGKGGKMVQFAKDGRDVASQGGGWRGTWKVLRESWDAGYEKMWREAARSARESVAAVKDAAGLWKSEGFMAVLKNLFTGQPGFFKDLVALTQGLSNMSMRLTGGGQILVVLVGGKAITIGVVDFIKSSIVDPSLQLIPTPQPATRSDES